MCVFFGVDDFLHGVPRDCHGYANNSVPIQVAPFQSEAMHMPVIPRIPWPARKEIATLERRAIKISFNFSRLHHYVMLAGIEGM